MTAKETGWEFREIAWVAGGWIVFWCVITVLSHLDFAAKMRASDEAALSASVMPLQTYVNDFAGALSPGVAQRLTEALVQFEKETSNQVAVAIYPRLPQASVEDFTMAVAEKSRLGRKGLDNGAILSIFVQDKIARLEVGYGLEGALTDAAAHRMLESVLAPAWAHGEIDKAVEGTLAVIVSTVREEYRAGNAPGPFEILRHQVAVELPRFLKTLLPALMEVQPKEQIAITIIGTFLVLGLWDGVLQTVRLARNAGMVVRNYRKGKVLTRGTKSIQLESISDSLTVVLLFGFILAGLVGVVVVAAGGAFGGGGATLHW